MEFFSELSYWQGMLYTLFVSIVFYCSIRFAINLRSYNNIKFDLFYYVVLQFIKNFIIFIISLSRFSSAVLRSDRVFQGMIVLIFIFLINYISVILPNRWSLSLEKNSRFKPFISKLMNILSDLIWDVSIYSTVCLAAIVCGGNELIVAKVSSPIILPPVVGIGMTLVVFFGVSLLMGAISRAIHQSYLIKEDTYNGPSRLWETMEAIRRYVADEVPSDRSPERIYSGRDW